MVKLPFDSSRDVAQPGSAPAWGVGGREFKSRHPDQILEGFTPASIINGAPEARDRSGALLSMASPLILVTNDDGVHAPGLKALASALRALGDGLRRRPRPRGQRLLAIPDPEAPAPRRARGRKRLCGGRDARRLRQPRAGEAAAAAPRPRGLGDQPRREPRRGRLLLRDGGRRARRDVLRRAVDRGVAGRARGREVRVRARRRLCRPPGRHRAVQGAAGADAAQRERPSGDAGGRGDHGAGPAPARGNDLRGDRSAAAAPTTGSKREPTSGCPTRCRTSTPCARG